MSKTLSAITATAAESHSNYRICPRCIMDTTDPEIRFDRDGVCHHCQDAERLFAVKWPLYKTGPFQIDRITQAIKAAGKGKRYDCVIGVSGGVDSTYLAYVAHQYGLRPVAVHFDNGWNSELAVKNIENTLHTLGIDLDTFVMDWEEFRDLQLSFLKASVPDLEVPTDHAIMAVLLQTAIRHDVRYILLGSNLATESILPRRWAYGFTDWRYIKAIHQRFGAVPLRRFPHYSLTRMAYYFGVRRLKTVSLLNSVEYTKARAMEVLLKELGWRNYGSKHHESIITKFLQTYILPKKFNIDKRRAHLSSLIMSGQVTRAAALEEIKQAPYDEKTLKEDKIYVAKKFGLTEGEFDELMARPPRCYHDYPNSFHRLERLKQFRNLLQRCHFLPKQVGW